MFLAAFTVCAAGPDASLNLKLTGPIKTWDEALPLGNGMMGALVWGQSNVLKVSLDRGDLWDERPSKKFVEVRDRFTWTNMQRIVAEKRAGEFDEIFDANYDYEGPPTKLPAGRLEVTLDPSQNLSEFELDLANAEAIVRSQYGNETRAFVDAANVSAPLAFLRIPAPAIKGVRLLPPASLQKLGYPAAREGQEGNVRWFEQPVWMDSRMWFARVGRRPETRPCWQRRWPRAGKGNR